MNKKLFFSMLVLLLSSAFIYAQKKVSGTVSDKSGVPLAGASVIVKGTSNGTSTDFDGNYSLNVQEDSDVLVISYIGFKSVEITVGNQTTISVSLEEDAESLDEVVVSVLGFKEKTLPVPLSITEPVLGGSPNLATAKNKESFDK